MAGRNIGFIGLAAGLVAALLAVAAPSASAASEQCTDVILVLDESGSIASNESIVRSAIDSFLEGVRGNGIFAGIVEFGTAANRVFGYTKVTAANISALFLPYLYGTSGGDSYDSPSQTGPFTNWDDALDEVSIINASDHVAPLVLFVTDGDPTAYNRDQAGEDGGITTSSDPQSLIRAVAEADEIKAQGSHIITIGVGSALTSSASLSRLQAVSGPDVFDGAGTLDLAATDVVLVPDFADLPEVLALIAQAMCADPAISIVKSADFSAVTAGSEVTYTIEVTNTGNVPLSGVSVSDPLVPACSATIGELAVGETVTVGCTTNLWAPLTNIATATGVDPFGTEVSATDPATVSLLSSGTGTPGYWKNHDDVWPVADGTLIIGDWNHDWECSGDETCLTLSQEDALAALTTPPKGDATWILARALVTAWLNVSAGNDASCIAGTIDAAVAWLQAYPIGSGVGGGAEAWSEAAPLAAALDDYNNGLLCGVHRDAGGDDELGDTTAEPADSADSEAPAHPKPGKGKGKAYGKGGNDK